MNHQRGKVAALAAVLGLLLCSCSLGGLRVDGDYLGGTVDMPNLDQSAQMPEAINQPVILTAENAQAMLQQVQRPQSYVWQVKATWYSGDRFRTVEGRVWAEDGKYRLESWENGACTGCWIIRDGSIYTFNPNMTMYWQREYGEGDSFDSLLAIGGIGDFYPISAGNITESTLYHAGTAKVLDIRVRGDTLGVEDPYIFFMDNAVPRTVESTVDGQRSYTLETTYFRSQAEQADYDIPPQAKKQN